MLKKLMKYLSVFTCILLLCSCNRKLVKKRLENEKISVLWYYYSEITNFSPDKIEVTSKSDHDLFSSRRIVILEAENAITDVNLIEDSLIITVVNAWRISDDIASVERDILNHAVVFDTTGEDKDLIYGPMGIKTCY
jgi:hypothetical protein